ncbi:MAG: iron-sulfur cluster assembly accessory protein [Hyphomicrobiaceae bacterium]
MSAAVTVTDRALRRVAQIVQAETGPRVLRVSVEGGGCSGFQYRFDLVDGPEADDLVVTGEGATVAVDRLSLDYMSGAEIDFVDDLIGQSFKVKNPLATAACGCGTSFAL